MLNFRNRSFVFRSIPVSGMHIGSVRIGEGGTEYPNYYFGNCNVLLLNCLNETHRTARSFECLRLFFNYL